MFKIIKLNLHLFFMVLFNQNGNLLMGGDGGSGGDGGDDGGASGGIGGDNGTGGASGDGGTGDSGADDVLYPDGLDEGLRGNPTLLKFYDKENKNFKVPNMMKALVHAQSMVGADKIQKPKDSWSDEQWQDFHRASGLPESIDQYKVENKNLPEGAAEDKVHMEKFKEVAYKAGLRPKQAEEVVGFFNQLAADKEAATKVEAQTYLQNGKRELELEYGTKLDGALQRGDHALSTIASSSEIAKMQEVGLTNEPLFAKFLIKVADMFGEGNAFNDDAQKDFGMTPEEASMEMEQMMKPDHPFKASRDPKVKAQMRDKWMKLAKIKNSGRKNRQGRSGSAMM